MTPIDHASDVVSLLTATSTNGGGGGTLLCFGSGGVSGLRRLPARRGANKALKIKIPHKCFAVFAAEIGRLLVVVVEQHLCLLGDN